MVKNWQVGDPRSSDRGCGRNPEKKSRSLTATDEVRYSAPIYRLPRGYYVFRCQGSWIYFVLDRNATALLKEILYKLYAHFMQFDPRDMCLSTCDTGG